MGDGTQSRKLTRALHCIRFNATGEKVRVGAFKDLALGPPPPTHTRVSGDWNLSHLVPLGASWRDLGASAPPCKHSTRLFLPWLLVPLSPLRVSCPPEGVPESRLAPLPRSSAQSPEHIQDK